MQATYMEQVGRRVKVSSTFAARVVLGLLVLLESVLRLKVHIAGIADVVPRRVPDVLSQGMPRLQMPLASPAVVVMYFGH